jgi:hypothetical protein
VPSVTAEDVADDVESAVGELRVDDVWGRSGNQPGGDYVEPTEAAWEVLEEAVAPFIEDLERRIALGSWRDAAALCQGTLLGLYRVSQEQGEPFLDGWAPDSLEEAAGLVAEAWSRGARRAASKGAGGARERAALRRFVSEALPEWRSFLIRELGPGPVQPRKGTGSR